MTFPTPLAASFAVLVLGLTSNFPASAQDSMVLDLQFRESLSRRPDAGGARTEESRPLPAQRREGTRRLKGRQDEEARLSQRRREDGR